MAVSPTPPSISILPPAPLPTDAEAVFDAKAGVRLTAEEVMVTEQNAALAWQAGSMAETKGYKDAAAISAGAASDSAIAASGFKNAAAQQVGLAADQVALANTAKGEAQAAALAAGAAAGLPPERVPFSVLQINGAGAVGWGYGLPDRAAAQAGYSLILGPGKVPTWGFASDQIGDILYTSRAPGSTYLPANGGIYLQSAYPQLFAQIGLIGGQRATSFVAKSATPPFASMEFGENGVVLGVSGTAGTAGNVYKSTDYGLTFALVSTASANGANLLHLGGSKWLGYGNGTNTIIISSDDGATWIPVSVAPGYSATTAATDKAGTILLVMSNSVVYRSINYGVTFTSLSFNLGIQFCYAGAGRWVSNYSGNQTYLCSSSDAFSTWSLLQVPNLLALGIYGFASDPTTGVVVGFVNGGTAANLNLVISYDFGVSFTAAAAGGAYSPRSLVFCGADTWLICCYSTTSAYEVRKSVNGAKTFSAGPVANTSVSPLRYTADALKGYVIANCQAAGAGSYSVSAPALGYDGATQFKVPTLTKQEGVSPYVKAV